MYCVYAHAGSSIVSQTFIESENSQVFLSDGCSLRSLDPARFNDQMAGRRIIFLGDSLMRGNWQSLACWLADQVGMNPDLVANMHLRNEMHLADACLRHGRNHRGAGSALLSFILKAHACGGGAARSPYWTSVPLLHSPYAVSVCMQSCGTGQPPSAPCKDVHCWISEGPNAGTERSWLQGHVAAWALLRYPKAGAHTLSKGLEGT